MPAVTNAGQLYDAWWLGTLCRNEVFNFLYVKRAINPFYRQ